MYTTLIVILITTLVFISSSVISKSLTVDLKLFGYALLTPAVYILLIFTTRRLRLTWLVVMRNEFRKLDA